jgi:hypothetical protein
MKINADTLIVPADFPELALLVWNRDRSRPMPAGEVFAVYERNWRFVDREQLTKEETQLIRDLTMTFGNGVMLAS